MFYFLSSIFHPLPIPSLPHPHLMGALLREILSFRHVANLTLHSINPISSFSRTNTTIRSAILLLHL